MIENKIAIIGDKDLVEGFAAVGVYQFSPQDTREAILQCLEGIIKNNFSICFILEKYAQKIKEKIKELEQATYPAMVILPDYRGDFDLTSEFLRKTVARATGTESIGSLQR